MNLEAHKQSRTIRGIRRSWGSAPICFLFMS